MLHIPLKGILLSLAIGPTLFLPAMLRTQRTGATAQDRNRPPSMVKCDRNNLTSYTGQVISYIRRTKRTTLRIHTDWDTTETVTLIHPKNNPARWFLLRGERFERGDWAQIESSNKLLRPQMRVTAWVCDDGSNPVIDWQPPADEAGPAN